MLRDYISDNLVNIAKQQLEKQYDAKTLNDLVETLGKRGPNKMSGAVRKNSRTTSDDITQKNKNRVRENIVQDLKQQLNSQQLQIKQRNNSETDAVVNWI